MTYEAGPYSVRKDRLRNVRSFCRFASWLMTSKLIFYRVRLLENSRMRKVFAHEARFYRPLRFYSRLTAPQFLVLDCVLSMTELVEDGFAVGESLADGTLDHIPVVKL